MLKKALLSFLVLVLAGVVLYPKLKTLPFVPRKDNASTPGVKFESGSSEEAKDVEIVATNLDIPWEVVFLPDGAMLVTERSGKLLKVTKETKIVKEIEGVKHIGEGGLLGIAIHPKFSANDFVYIYSTTQGTNGITNRVERYKLSNDNLSDRTVIIEGIKGSSNHDGGRISFGPDGYLYITTGDAEEPGLAQDKNSLNGKILRIKDDGSIPSDNPFGNAVYSMGHRNPQGLAWDRNGTLWQTEHGPSGSQTGNDEINIIRKGENYGWPETRGMEKKEGMVTPIIESGKSDTWAPAGVSYLDGSLFFAGLRGQALYQAKIGAGNSLTLTAHFKNEFGRLRAVVLGPDNFLYVTTSNTDGRGQAKQGDDKILKINPKFLSK